jgi:transcriptional regulator GlxA family with amidase domain
MSFNTYVNQFRVNEATELMRMDWNESIKMEEIAEKSGFGSLKSFQRSFKDHTGQNPLNFRKNLQKDVPLLKKA